MKSTTDIWFTAFLRLKGYTLSNFEVISKGRGRYEFDLTEEDWKKLKMEFVNSDASRMKQFIQELKDLLY